MKRTSKHLVIATVALVLTVAAMIGATLAIFSDTTANQNNHLQAGNLSVVLQQTSFEGERADAQGLKEHFVNNDVVDLKQSTDKIFSLQNFLPGMYATSNMKITNSGSVAFDYKVLVNGVEVEGANSQALMSQIKIVVKQGNVVKGEFLLSDVPTDGVAVGTVLVGSDNKQDFSVTAMFVPSDDNNSAKLGAVSFDLTIVATQKIN